jgi:hypothetical protein
MALGSSATTRYHATEALIRIDHPEAEKYPARGAAKSVYRPPQRSRLGYCFRWIAPSRGLRLASGTYFSNQVVNWRY